jgi:hypothetical protein
MLPGTFLDPDELNLVVVMIANTADEFDDELQAKFGGRRCDEEARFASPVALSSWITFSARAPWR